MLLQLNSVVIDAEPANRQEMAGFLAGLGVNVVASIDSLEPLPALLRDANEPWLVLINLDPNPHDRLFQLGRLTQQFPATHFFVMSTVVEASLVIEAMQQGVRQFLPLPLNVDKFRASLERLASTQVSEKRSKTIQVIPSMGGCGSTTVACNVAAMFARSAKTLLLDLDLAAGSVATAFDLHPRFTLADLMDPAQKLDRQLLDNAMALHAPTGLAILARPELPEESQRVTVPGLRRVLDVVEHLFDYVVIDSVMSFDPLYAAATRAADLNVIVMQLNIPSARNAERLLGALRRMGVEEPRIRVIVNRFCKRGNELTVEDIERSLGMKVAWTVPNDFRNTIHAVNYGQPVTLRAPRAEVSSSLGGLARLLNGRVSKAVAPTEEAAALP